VLDREMLKDIGFVQGFGWDHEVWVYNGIFWVHFSPIIIPPKYSGTEVNASVTRRQFFQLFIACVVNSTLESHGA
jgi:hypothetical protein